MKWPVILAICVLAALVLAELILAWSLFRKAFGRGKMPVSPGANAGEIGECTRRLHAALGEASAWLEAHSPEKLAITARDGTVLRAWLIYAEKPTKSFVVGVHGYKSSMLSDIALSAEFYHGLGKNILLVDDRAHGSSEGRYVGFGWLDRLDVIDWCRCLTERFGEDVKLLLHGVSMGSTTVCCASGEAELPEQVVGIVSDCGFSSGWREIKYAAEKIMRIPTFPLIYIVDMYLRLLAHYSLRDCDAVKSIKKARVPFLFIHGGADRFVPTEMARELYDACPTEKTLFIVPGAIHAMSWLTDTGGCMGHIIQFMDKTGF